MEVTRANQTLSRAGPSHSGPSLIVEDIATDVFPLRVKAFGKNEYDVLVDLVATADRVGDLVHGYAADVYAVGAVALGPGFTAPPVASVSPSALTLPSSIVSRSGRRRPPPRACQLAGFALDLYNALNGWAAVQE